MLWLFKFLGNCAPNILEGLVANGMNPVFSRRCLMFSNHILSFIKYTEIYMTYNTFEINRFLRFVIVNLIGLYYIKGSPSLLAKPRKSHHHPSTVSVTKYCAFHVLVQPNFRRYYYMIIPTFITNSVAKFHSILLTFGPFNSDNM